MRLGKFLSSLVLGLGFGISVAASAFGASPQLPNPDENLPPLLETAPQRRYEVLTPIGAGKKEILEARLQLRREGAKAQAEAILLLTCEPGGMARSGLTFYHKDAYCRGLAIRYTQP